MTVFAYSFEPPFSSKYFYDKLDLGPQQLLLMTLQALWSCHQLEKTTTIVEKNKNTHLINDRDSDVGVHSWDLNLGR